MTKQLKIGDRVVISDEQAKVLEKYPDLYPTLDPKVEMTIVRAMYDKKNPRHSLYWAWSDPCKCCGHRKQQMQNFAGLWFKKIADAPAGTSQEALGADVQKLLGELDKVLNGKGN